ncbi:His-Xaa-Ser system protein HxsD [Pseudomonas putida]|uniref:His-Xaa-Ser system protein HxsD n=1 Tax=Pseudomonas putida TaxID=303 RepID=A0A2S3WCR3_PSEPU|nr:His-Xaa-Ser system protein HxsD [Pseudomonas putida]POF88747.1 His-Xaa-Ser system protein HxsD [Pseudomonas putida]
MAWPVELSLCITTYPLSVVQRTIYSLADTLAIQVGSEPDHINLAIFPAQPDQSLSQDRARTLVLQQLNDFALRDRINHETAGLREALIRAALNGCEIAPCR